MIIFQAVTADKYEFDIASDHTLKVLAGILRIETGEAREALKNKKAISTPYTKVLGYPAVYIRRIEL